MAFSDFRYPDVLAQLGLTINSVLDLFPGVPPVPPSASLAEALPMNVHLATMGHTEAARSTWLVGPVLGDFWARYAGRISLFAGVEFIGDADAGLSGYVDFIIGLLPQLPDLVAPAAVIFEAKRDSIPGGLAQCIAGMAAVQRFNRRAGKDIDPVYGCVTTGSLWKFLRLAGTHVTIDLDEYSIHQTAALLGVLTFIVGPVPAPAAA